ncbi:hypothetical protein [Mucilaginibacter defluvii]|uniref:Uncharacterized protein n=1 Tax=Mucilaginibacter defluvii TaxID=1196019 RepID=A0ABP9FN24_9SPHI
MNKHRILPVFDLYGTDFIVDVNKQVLREAERPANEISFISDMSEHQNLYLLRYDQVTKRPEAERTDQYIEVTEVPSLIELDPEGMSLKYSIPVEQLKGKTDFEVMVDQELLADRRRGILPQIDINGEAFVIDLKLQELRHAKYFFPVISLKSFDLTDDGWHYTAFYDTMLKQPLTLDPKLLEMPDHVIQVKLPNEIGLDPVFTAQKYGMDERELLRRHPIQKELKAEVIPLSETDVPRLIRQNKDELRQQHEANRQRSKPRQRPRF